MERLSVVCSLIVLVACGGDDSGTSESTKTDAGQEPKSSVMEDVDASAAGDSAASDVEPGLDCMGTCELMVGPMCEKGPPSVGLCVLLCDSTIKGDNEMCRDAFQDLLDCVDPTIDVSCDDDGKIVASRCQDEVDGLDPCLPSL